MLLNFQNAIDNKSCENYQSLIDDSSNANILNADTNQYTHATHEQPKSKSKSRKVRGKIQKLKRNNNLRQQNERYIQNMSNEKLSNEEISQLSKGLKFVTTPNTNEKPLRRQLMQDFNEFERRMRWIYFNLYLQTTRKNRIPSMSNLTGNHQLHNPYWALDSYLDEVKLDLSEASFTKPKDNLTNGECKALKDLKNNTKIYLKKADKGTTTVVMIKDDKIKVGQSQLDNTDHYQSLDHPMVIETASKVTSVIEDLYAIISTFFFSLFFIFFISRPYYIVYK